MQLNVEKIAKKDHEVPELLDCNYIAFWVHQFKHISAGFFKTDVPLSIPLRHISKLSESHSYSR